MAGNSSLGGIDFDHVIGGILKRKLSGKYEITPKLEAEIASKTEFIKKTLSEDLSMIVRLQIDGFVEEITITRDEFERDSEPLLQSAMDTANQALLDPRFQDDSSKSTNIRAVECYNY